jgi:dienelactone hydrolase
MNGSVADNHDTCRFEASVKVVHRVAQRRRAPLPGLLGLRAAVNATIFLFKLYPMLPSGALNYVTPAPVVERMRYPTSHGPAEGDLYRPSRPGPYPGVVVCLGVVPFGVDHPQVPRLGAALARSGIAALLYWSPAMRDFRLVPEDIGDLASAYDRLLARPDIDPARSGLLGTCVGGAFALMAAADRRIRERIGFIGTYAPYASMWTLSRDIAGSTRTGSSGPEPWQVDPLTRKVFVHSLTALLDQGEADRLRGAFAGDSCGGSVDAHDLSADGHAVYPLLTAPDRDAADAALRRLPAAMQQRLTAMSPTEYLHDVRAPLIVIMHDRDDPVIPVGESRRLRAALGRRAGVRYTEFTVFKHLDPTRGKPSPLPLAWELGRFCRAVYPMFRRTAGP